jgi:hypothetical protein|tara:strand:- start:427 stop:531 length:105 start_codon:yes stop_codon:yes gene_type:complete
VKKAGSPAFFYYKIISDPGAAVYSATALYIERLL